MLFFGVQRDVLRYVLSPGLGAAVLVAVADGASAIVIDLGPATALHEPRAPHIDQTMLTALTEADPDLAFETAFEVGDELFETVFNAIDGVGANVGNGQRFTRVPRADLRGGTEWFDHRPARETGPNAENCNACHNLPFDDAAGNASGNVHRDPRRGGLLGQMIQRNAPHLFAPGAVQRLAEEMTASCHRATFTLGDPTFSEPSQSEAYRDAVFPAGQNPVAEGIDPKRAVRFDLTRDQPDNRLLNPDGSVRFRLGSLRVDPTSKKAQVDLGGDLKRHDLGRGLAESVDETGTGASVFLTENLWGVGSTAPYLHDGRATTLTEAILEHGGEAAASRAAFTRLGAQAQADVVAYLENLVLFKLPEE